jgi:hypothetical protein
VVEVHEQTRERLVGLTLGALGRPDDARRRQLVRAWFAFTEDLVDQWVREPRMERAELVELLRGSSAGRWRVSPRGPREHGPRPRSPAAAGG